MEKLELELKDLGTKITEWNKTFEAETDQAKKDIIERQLVGMRIYKESLELLIGK